MMRIAVLLGLMALVPSAHAQSVSIPQPPIFHPGFVAGNWYLPAFYTALAATPAVNGANTVNCSFGSLLRPATISAIGNRITTASAGGNVQFAIYDNGSWGRPGNLLVATGNVSTTSTGVVNGSAAISLPAGNFWWCQNSDNGTVALQSQATGSGNTAQSYLGAAAQTNAGAGPGVNTTGIAFSQTFGTWPTFTSSTSWTEIQTNIAPYIAFRVSP